MSEGDEQTQAKKPFLKRFKLRDVQATLGSLKRSVSSRASKPVNTSPEPQFEQSTDSLPPYKELYVQQQAAESVLEELEQGYFEADFDVVDFELSRIQSQFGQEEVDAKVEKLTHALEVVSLQLSDRILDKHDFFVDGIEKVTSIETDLQQAHVNTVNTRIRVGQALEEVKKSTRIAQQTKLKQRYMEVLKLLELIKQATQLKHTLREVLENGDYVEAMMMCADCFEKLDSLVNIKVALDLKHSIHYLYVETIDRIDGALQAICTDFRPDEYKNILQCFVFQDITVNELSEKILHSFQDAIGRASSRVVRSLLVTKPALAEAMFSPKIESTFNQMCQGLPFDLLRPCLAKLLEVLFDILSSYHCMSSWHDIGLKHAQAELDQKEEEEEETTHRTVAILDSVHEILVQSRKVIWDSVARRVRDLLSGPAAVEGEHFLQVMEWCQKFLAAGEVFIKERSDLLRSIIAIQCGKFFQSYHGTNMDALEMLLRSEQFVNVSSATQKNPRFEASLAGILDQDDYESSQSMSEDSFDSWVAKGNPFRPNKHPDHGKRKADLTLGFGGASNMEDDLAAQLLEVDSSGFPSRVSPESSESLSAPETPSKREETDSEEENPELFGEDIDEETQTVRMSDPTTAMSLPEPSGRSEVILTNSAHQILKWLKNYASLFRPLSSKTEAIFYGMCDLFDAYFLDVFLFVGGISLSQLVWEEDLITTRLRSTLLRILTGEGHKYKEEIEKIKLTNPNPKVVNPQMKFTMDIKSFANRFNSTKGLNLGFPNNNGTNQTTIGSPRHNQTLPSEQASLLSMSNMYGLRETVVAVGSIQLLAKELSQAKSRIQTLLPVTATRAVEIYFSRTVDATEDLRECAFRNASRRILHQLFDQEKGVALLIANTSYDTHEPSDSHNTWAHTLGEHISRFSELINYTKLPDDMVIQMWEHAMKACSEVILDGLSQVKKCTMTGRSMMSLDLSYIESNFRFMAPSEVLINLRIVDAYIKAYYLPWEDLPKWVELNHAEYGKQKVVALFYLIVDRLNSLQGKNLKKTDIRAMLSEIESSMVQP